ncbi:MAG: hypothetical protein NC181_01905 [Clostridium sp.]|nr:hypothetical protein [Clostridium sp.]MCM1444062.1 hypothetical protein [Candidatus Amulumruptor caecigallinarius]
MKNLKGLLATLTAASIAVTSTACSTSKENKEELENTKAISIDDELVEKTTSIVTEETVILTTKPEETTKEESELEKYTAIKYIDEKELAEILKKAEKEFEGTEVTLEELCAFVYTINKTVINSELKGVLVETGVISGDEDLVRKNYQNTIDKTRDAMYFENVYETFLEIDKETAQEYNEHGKAIHVSNMVSKNSSEYETYKVLDEVYEKIGAAKTIEEVRDAYLPVWGYVNSIYGENMPNNVEEEIYNDLYEELYSMITEFNLDTSLSDIIGYSIEEVDSCEKVYSLS